MGLGMHLVLLRPRRNRCAPVFRRSYPYIGRCSRDVNVRSWLVRLARHLGSASPVSMYNPSNPFGGKEVSMELKTQTLDRLLEAISPVLGAEIDHVIEDLHRKL